MIRTHCLGLWGTTGLALGFVSGCTTNTNQMTDAYNQGRFAEAAIAGDEAFPVLRDDGGSMSGIKLDRMRASKDRLWVGLEKAKILGDAGRFGDSLEVYDHVYDESAFLSALEADYALNPLDAGNWDIGQFTEDVGQAVVGADQTAYIVQPYEAILLSTYASLDALFSGSGTAATWASVSMDLQSDLFEDFENAGIPVRAAADKVLDSKLQKEAGKDPDLKGKNLSGLSLTSILNFNEFGRTRKELDRVVNSAVSNGTASPVMPFASVVQWAAYYAADAYPSASSALSNLREISNANTLADQLQALQAESKPDNKVLVLVGSGRGPERDYFSVRVPVPIPGIGNGYYRGVYPFLAFRDRETRPTNIKAGGSALSTLDSIDAIAAQNFSRREPTLWWGPTVRGLLRTAASIVAQALDEKEDSLFDLAILATNVAMAEAEQADLRMWTALPAEHYAGLVDRPADGRLAISLGAGSGTSELAVEVPEGVSLVYVRALEPTLAVAHATSLSK
jgi:hypothetical protein